MKLLHLRSGDGLFGPENVILALSRGLKAAGHTVAMMNLHPPHDAPAALVEAAKALQFEARDIACRYRLDFAVVGDLSRYLLERRVDLIHSHDYKSDIYAFLSGRAANVRCVATCHNWASDSPMMSLYKAADKLVLRRFSKVAVVSDPLKRELVLSGVGREKLVNIPNGVDVGALPPRAQTLRLRERLGIAADEGVVVAVGRLSIEKGHRNLIAAAAAVTAARPRTTFLIVGDGPLRRPLEEEARARGHGERFLFLGERRDVKELLAASDVFVLPSFKEGLPMALLEAMASGRPVVAARVGEIPVVVVDGVSGLLVDPADAAALSRAIIRLLSSPEEAAAMGAAGCDRVREAFSGAAMVGRYLEFYREALAS